MLESKIRDTEVQVCAQIYFHLTDRSIKSLISNEIDMQMNKAESKWNASENQNNFPSLCYTLTFKNKDWKYLEIIWRKYKA